MSDRDQRREDRATKVQAYGIQNSADFTASGKAKTHFANIANGVSAWPKQVREHKVLPAC
jgi:hypothetical protein